MSNYFLYIYFWVFLVCSYSLLSFFFFNDTATIEIYTLSLHDALPISFSCRKLFLQESFQSVQRAVSERGGDNSTLGSPVRRFVKNVFFHVPGFQPLLENDSVHRDEIGRAHV